ncbi:MAG: aspartate kinase [Oscillospiraceae bacterium]|jgi:aspartate kinase|nr:aspartate kinase [Oscillospiraceae bacterium]
MNLIVQKFGGSSVCDPKHIFNVADIITKKYNNNTNIIVVISAQGRTTDKLLEKSRLINKKASKREIDVLLSSGEQVSAALLVMAIEKLGVRGISLLGWQINFETDSNHGDAEIKSLSKKRIISELKKKKIVVIAGFQGVDSSNDITTLGRGGSDVSAVALAATFCADVCQIYTDVDGVYDVDPNKFPNATKINEISYDNMLDLSLAGAEVVNARSIEIAKKYNIKLEVLSSFKNTPGTIIK